MSSNLTHDSVKIIVTNKNLFDIISNNSKGYIWKGGYLDDSLFRDEFNLTQKSRWTHFMSETYLKVEPMKRLKKHQEDRLNVIGHESNKEICPFDELIKKIRVDGHI